MPDVPPVYPFELITNANAVGRVVTLGLGKEEGRHCQIQIRLTVLVLHLYT